MSENGELDENSDHSSGVDAGENVSKSAPTVSNATCEEFVEAIASKISASSNEKDRQALVKITELLKEHGIAVDRFNGFPSNSFAGAASYLSHFLRQVNEETGTSGPNLEDKQLIALVILRKQLNQLLDTCDIRAIKKTFGVDVAKEHPIGSLYNVQFASELMNQQKRPNVSSHRTHSPIRSTASSESSYFLPGNCVPNIPSPKRQKRMDVIDLEALEDERIAAESIKPRHINDGPSSSGKHGHGFYSNSNNRGISSYQNNSFIRKKQYNFNVDQ